MKKPTVREFGGREMMNQNILITPELRDRVKRYASANGIKIFKVHELALVKFLEAEEKDNG